MTALELKEFACFADLSDEEREVFSGLVQEVELEPGEEVFRQGEDADGLLLILSGRLRLARDGGGIEGTLGPGAALGALSLVAPGPREACASAETAARVLWLSRSAYRRVAEDAPRAACRFLEHVLAEFVALVRPELAHFARADVDPSRRAE